MTPTVDVVIVTFNTEALVLQCVSALRGEAVTTVTVVDNAGHDDTAATLRERHPEVAVIELEQPLGFGAACNLGARGGNSEIVLFLNSDIVTKPGAVSLLCEELASHTRAVAAAGRLVDPGTDTTQDRYRPWRFPTLTSMTVQAFGGVKAWPGNPVSAYAHGRWLTTSKTSVVQAPAGACIAVWRHTFEAIGGFDEAYWFWYEDVDLGKRLSVAGEVLWVPAAAFEHVGGASFSKWSAAESATSRIYGLVRYLTLHFNRRQRIAAGVLLGSAEFLRSLWGATEKRRAHRSGSRLLAGVAIAALRGRSNPDAQ